MVIAVVGEGKTGIVREAIYVILKNHLPVRRNLETPDAEFVLPLTVLGTQEYPTSSFGWLKLLLKSVGQLFFLPKHKNLLVLEIGYTNKEIFDYFWKITQPEILVLCGKAPYLSSDQIAPKTFTVRETEDLRGYLQAALKVAESFGIGRKEAEEVLANFTLPRARIRILPAKGGGLIVDASYEYFPPQEETLDEILEALPGKKVLLTPTVKTKPKEIKNGEVAVLLGQSQKMWPFLLELSKEPWA